MSINNPVSLVPYDRSKNLNRGGRPKGSTNLAKRNAREAIKILVEKNIPRVQKWLDTIEKEQGAQAAYRCFVDLIEYAVPKMSREEIIGPHGDGGVVFMWSAPQQPGSPQQSVTLELGANEVQSIEQGMDDKQRELRTYQSVTDRNT